MKIIKTIQRISLIYFAVMAASCSTSDGWVESSAGNMGSVPYWIGRYLGVICNQVSK